MWPAFTVMAGCLATEDPVGHEAPVGNAIEAVRVCADGPTIEGIDVSHWQGSIDWIAVHNDGIVFAFMKATQGTDFIDSEFSNNWIGARDAGVIRGAYHFFCPNLDGTAQADLLLETMGPLDAGDLPPVLDVEGVPASICPPCCSSGVSCADMAARIGQWVDRIEAVTGRSPIIYTGRSFWEGSVCNDTGVNDVPLWVANWEVTCPDIPSAWADWVFWQTADNGSEGGIDPVDLDVFNGDAAALAAFIGSGPACGDGRCSGGETCLTCPDDCGACIPDVDETEDAVTEPDAPADIPPDVVADEIDAGEPVAEADTSPEAPAPGDADADPATDRGGNVGLESDVGCSCSMTF
jgi:lysozyme